MPETFTETLRRIDDADLDAYQRSMMFHIWRVGKSWESLKTLSEKCGMSKSKAHTTRQWLLDNNWLEYVETDNGRMAVQIVKGDNRPSQGQTQQNTVPPKDKHNNTVPPKDGPSLPRTVRPSQGRVLKNTYLNGPNEIEWSSLLSFLQISVSAATFEKCFSGSNGAFEDGVLVVRAKNQSAADWINGRLTDVVKSAYHQIANGEAPDEIKVWARPKKQAAPLALKSAKVKDR